MTLPRVTVVLSLLIAMSSGCEKSPPAVSDATLPPADSSSPTSKTASDITEAEAITFAEHWTESVLAGDQAKCQQLVSWKSILNRAIDPLNPPEEFKRGFMEGAGTLGTNLVNAIRAETQATGTYRVVRITNRGGHKHAVFRIHSDAGAINYHDLRIVRLDGQVCADYFFIAATGEDFADTMRKAVAPTIASNASAIGRLSGQAKEDMDNLQTMQRLALAVRSGKNNEALTAYRELPKSVQEQKLPMLYRVMATDIEDEANYLTAVDDYAEKFPGDASLGLVTLDAAIIRNDMGLLEESRKSIQEWTGGDPFIDLLAGGVMANAGQAEQAAKLAQDVDVDSLGMSTAHDFKLTIALALDDHADVLKQLQTLRDVYGFEFDDLSKADGFERFAQSPEHAIFTGE